MRLADIEAVSKRMEATYKESYYDLLCRIRKRRVKRMLGALKYN